MARDETDRENLLREATALIERIELCATGSATAPTCATGFASAPEAPAENIIAGFRLGGALSIFFGADPVYQFNAAGELRRAYCDGLLYKASHGRLASLERLRTPHEVQLLRRDLSDEEQNAFIARMGDRLRAFAAQLNAGEFRTVGQAPPEVDVLGRVRSWLSQHDGLPIAHAPSATHI